MSERREVDRDNLERHLEYELKKRGLTRRDLVKGGAGFAAAIGLGSLFAACGGDDDEGGEAAAPAPATPEPPAATPEPAEPPAEAFTGTLRVLGLGVDLIDPIKEAAEQDLGFTLQFDVTDTVTMEQRVLTQPDSFDVFSGYHYQYDRIWSSGNLQPVDITKITRWGEVNNIFKVGRVDPANTTCTVGAGDAPFRTMYVDPDQSGTWQSSTETREENQGVIVSWADDNSQTTGDEPAFINGVPQNFNMDSMGYNTDVIQMEPEEVSWGELFNPSYRGRVALLADPGIALQDAGMAAIALGLIEVGSVGNMTQEEMDAMFTILNDLKRQGQFRAFWTTFDESVQLMASGEVVLESMWSPAVALLVVQGVPVRYAAPPEGFRGWSDGQAIATSLTDPAKLQAAYDYFNWWLDGVPGAIMMRQGYYNAVQETSRQYVEPEEWAFWIDGEAAASDLPGITGQVGDIKSGQVRDGGSFTDRACSYATWNSHPQEEEYLVQRWNEFQAA
jgi:putative spermidine/putrescine transport system substrate-binding protein